MMTAGSATKDQPKTRREKRREPRLKIEVRLKLKLQSKEADSPLPKLKDYLTFTSEISAGGCRVLLPLELKKEETIDLELYLPRTKKIIKVLGEVRWQKMSYIGGLYETGLEFKSIAADDKLALMEFLYLDRRQKEIEKEKD
ncbi:MAG: PilZ domain-containing protein [Candidatus Aminicenantales bacterium]